MVRRNWMLLGSVVAALLVAISPQVAPAGTVDFSLAGQGITAAGRFHFISKTVTGYDGPIWQLSGIDGTFSDTVSGVAGVISGLVPGSNYTNLPSRTNHDSFPATGKPFPPASYDNILFPRGDSPVDCFPFYDYTGGTIDMYGILFQVELAGGGTWLVNIWSNGNLNNAANPLGVDFGVAVGPLGVDGNGAPEWHVSRYLGDGNEYQTDPTAYNGSGISFTYTPEPSSYLLAASSVAILGLMSRRRRVRQSA
ncbi:MAG: hypothetical protein ACKOFW_17865 [Planctomycetaceae bacterium]